MDLNLSKIFLPNFPQSLFPNFFTAKVFYYMVAISYLTHILQMAIDLRAISSAIHTEKVLNLAEHRNQLGTNLFFIKETDLCMKVDNTSG